MDGLTGVVILALLFEFSRISFKRIDFVSLTFLRCMGNYRE